MTNVSKILENIKVDSRVVETIFELEELYAEYIKILQNYDQVFVKKFLDVYEKRETMYNREMEGVDSLTALFVSELEKKHTALSFVTNKLLLNKIITSNDFKDTHAILMKSDPRSYLQKGDYRSKRADVGYFKEDKTPVIQYTAVPPLEIPQIMDEILNYCNQNEYYGTIDHPFIKSAILHALIVYYQPFQDGNSRMGRIIHHAKLWNDFNEKKGVKLQKPALYFSANYQLSRGGYRGKIHGLHNQLLNSEKWNEWLFYNINVMYEVFNHQIPKISKLYEIYEEMINKEGKIK